ncbi:MAG: AAC(3) family N-acetyltransferase, partial [Proteobacteria bacterium]|nr:AAC(3) family N-acetyltransferase [Pseudomonadota bacterium]
QSPSHTGAITEAFRVSDGAVRSAHPTHAMGLWGEGAEEIAAGHANTCGLDAESPYHLAAQRPGAGSLLIGVDSRRNSLVHVCEAILGLPYVDEAYWNDRRYSYDVIHLDSRVEKRENKRAPGCAKCFDRVDRELERAGRLRRVSFGAAPSLLLRPDDIMEAVQALIATRADAILCDEAQCGFCPGARRSRRKHGMV